METTFDEILDKIKEEYEIDNEIILSIKEKLSKEFYFRLKDFKNLDNKKWEKFGLPDNLFNLIEDKFKKEKEKKNEKLNEKLLYLR